MKNIIIVYGTTTGNTETVANTIAKNLTGDVKVVDVTRVKVDQIKEADLVLLGSSTWGYGDIQDDFLNFYDDHITNDLFNGKDVAVFGCGDEDSFPDTFCNAAQLITDKVIEVGANLVAETLKIDQDPSDHLDKIVAFAQSL